MRIKQSLEEVGNKVFERRKVIGFVILVLLLFLYLYRNLPFGKMFAYGDLSPFPRRPLVFWERFVFVWQNEYLGFPLPDVSFDTFAAIAIFVLGDPVLAQKVLLLSCMPCAIMSMYIFSGRFLDSDKSRFAASILYGLNPVSIGRFVNGGPLDVLFLYALLPLLWLQLLKILTGKKTYDVLLFAVLFGIVGSRVYAIFWAVIPFMAILILAQLFCMGYRNRSCLLGVIMVFLSVSLGLLLILPDIMLTFQRGETLVTQFPTLIKAVDWSYSTPTPLSLVRLAGNGGDPMMRDLGYNETNFWTMFGLLIPLIAFSSPFLAKKEKKQKVFLFLTIVIAVMLFILLTRVKLTYPLFKAFPTLFSLKNPVKIMYPMSLALCSLFGIGLDSIVSKVNEKTTKILLMKVKDAMLNASVLILILLYLFPVLGGGTVGLDEVYGDTYFIPTEYEAVLDWMNEQRQSSEFFRTLWLPYDYTTQIRLGAADPHNVGLRSGSAWLGIPNIVFVRDVFETICRGNTDNFGAVLRILDVKYVVVDISSVQTTECAIIEKQVTPWIVGSPPYFLDFADRQNDLNEVLRIGNLVIYENKKFAASRFSIYDSLIFLTPPPLDENISIATALTPNLLQNSDFETGLESWWTNGRASIDEGISIKGKNSARTTNYDQEIWASIAQSVSAEYGGTYYFSTWIKTQNVNGAHVKLVWFDEIGTIVGTDYLVEKSEITGTKDWFHVTKVIRAPKNATMVSIRLVGGLSSDEEMAAITWFDNVEFYETPSIPPDSFVPNFLILSNVHGFNSSKHLVAFEKGLSSNEILKALNVSNVIVFSNPTIDQLKEYADYIGNQRLLLIFEAETLPATAGRSLLLNSSMSNGEGIQLDGGVTFVEFYAPRSGYYKISIEGSMTNASISMDESSLHLRNQQETETFYIERDDHTLKLAGEGMILDQIQILSTTGIEDVDNVFEKEHDSTSMIESIESGGSFHMIQTESAGSSFLVLGESYHSDWKAYLHNENLEHYRAFGWCNAFYISETGKIEIEILFRQQALRDLSIIFWGVSWIVVLTVFFCLWILRMRLGWKQ